jgi:hypothetical protein
MHDSSLGYKVGIIGCSRCCHYRSTFSFVPKTISKNGNISDVFFGDVALRVVYILACYEVTNSVPAQYG